MLLVVLTILNMILLSPIRGSINMSKNVPRAALDSLESSPVQDALLGVFAGQVCIFPRQSAPHLVDRKRTPLGFRVWGLGFRGHPELLYA